MAVRNKFVGLHNEISGWRKFLHQHPELEFDTVQTAEFVKDKLREFGCDDIVTGVGRTGVVGVIHGKVNTSDKVVGLRADMDALPIQEVSEIDHVSTIPNKMHACGHDGHTSMLLGAAKYLSETRNFNGIVVVIFQPAEENGGGGKVMVDDGMMERFHIQEVYGMHNMPGLEVGSFAIRSGPFFAATNSLKVIVEGVGGHGAMPHNTVDTTLAASNIVVALQSIVARNVDPLKAAVVSICSLHTDTSTHNVIPQQVQLLGTIRSMDPDVSTLLIERINQVCQLTAETFGASARVEITTGYPVMSNDEQKTNFAIESAKRISNKVNERVDMFMGAEDFAFMLNTRPGAYILIGNGDTAPLHHPAYDFNDEAIPFGCSWWVEMAESRMPIESTL